MQVCDAAHREPGEIPHEDALCLRDRNREGADRRGLIHDEKHLAVTLQTADESAESCLVIRQCFVIEHCSGPVQGDGMVFALADVEADEDRDVVVALDGHDHSVLRSMNDSTAAASLGIHVTNGLSIRWVQPLSAITHCQPGPVTTPPRS